MNFFIDLLFGHLIGDYILQNKWMAMNKDRSTFKCLIHCLFYTASVIFIARIYNWQFIVLVFASHFIIDRWSIADKWLELIHGRSIKDFLKNGWQNIPFNSFDIKSYHALRAGFTALVYAVVDNTFHLIIMFYGWQILQRMV